MFYQGHGAIAFLFMVFGVSAVSAQEAGQLPTAVRAFQAERFQRGTDGTTTSAFEVFEWENNTSGLDSLASMFPTEYDRISQNRGALSVDGIYLAPIHMQNRGNRAVTIGIVDAFGNICRKVKIKPGGAENFRLCGNILKWHDTKQMVTTKIASGATYEVYWGNGRWLVKDVSSDKQ